MSKLYSFSIWHAPWRLQVNTLYYIMFTLDNETRTLLSIQRELYMVGVVVQDETIGIEY